MTAPQPRIANRAEARGRLVTPVSVVMLLLAVANIVVACLAFLERDAGIGLFDFSIRVGVSVLMIGWGLYLLAMRRRALIARGTRRPHQRVKLTLPALAALLMMIILFIGALIGRTNTMMLVAAMISGPFVVNGWLANVMLRRIQLARQHVERTTAGDSVWIELALTNDKRWFATWLTTVRDEITSEGESLDAEIVFTRTPARSTSSGRYQLRPMRRGRYALGPVAVRTSFPFGFVERSQLFDERSELIVHPRLGRLTLQWRRSRRHTEAQVRVQSSRTGGVEDEFQQLREFRAGDNLRKIHWRTSARRNELMIRDDRQSHAPPFTLLVDLWIPGTPDDAALDRVELAVSFVATLCVDQLTRNRDSDLRVGFSGADSRSWVGRSGPAGIEGLLDELAVVGPSDSGDLARIANETIVTTGPRTSIVLVTTRPPAELDRAVGDLEPDVRRRLADARIIEADPETLQSLFVFA